MGGLPGAELDQSLINTLLQAGELAFVISSAKLPDTPVVYASQSFYKLTGYGPAEVLGRNCRFLQHRHGQSGGAARSKARSSELDVCEMRNAMAEERECTVCLLNYRKDGTPFWNLCSMMPMKSEDGAVEAYLGVQVDVAPQVLAAARQDSNGTGVYVREACDAVEDPAEAEKRRLKDLLASWRAAQSGAELDLVGRRMSGPCAAPSLPASLQQPLMRLAQSFVLSDPSQPDCPIVYASQGFLELTRYPREKVLGRNCRFLQGPGTRPSAVARMREGLAAGRAVTVNLLNYRHDGMPFVNHLHIAPIRNSAGEIRTMPGNEAAVRAQVAYLVGVQLDVTAPGGGEQPAAAPAPATVLLQQKQVCGAVRIACRALCPLGLRRSACDQHLPSPSPPGAAPAT